MKRHQPKLILTRYTFKRNDGYHEIEMIMTTVDLNDRLTFHKRKDRKIVVEIEHNMYLLIIKSRISCSATIY